MIQDSENYNKPIRSLDVFPGSSRHQRHDVFISDSTLLNCIQNPGAIIRVKDRLKIFEYIHQIGIDKLLLLLFTKSDKDAAKAMIDCGFSGPELVGWSRANVNDINFILKTDGINEVGIQMHTSDINIQSRMGLVSRANAKEKYLFALQYARDHNLRLRAHFEDITRSDCFGFVFPLAKKILEIDPNCTLCIWDNQGPELLRNGLQLSHSVREIVKGLKDLGARNIEMQIQDGSGYEMSSLLDSAYCGANWLNLSFLGRGESQKCYDPNDILDLVAGMASGLKKYDLSNLTEFNNFLKEHIIKDLSVRTPTISRNVLLRRSSLCSAGQARNTFNFKINLQDRSLSGCGTEIQSASQSGSS